MYSFDPKLTWSETEQFTCFIDILPPSIFPQKVFVKDVAHIYHYMSHFFLKDLQKTLQQILGTTDFDYFPQWLAQHYQEDDDRVITTKEVQDYSERYIVGSNVYMVHTIKIPIWDDRRQYIMGVLGLFLDITSEELIKEEKEKLDLLSQWLKVGTFHYQPPIEPELYRSEKWCKILGCTLSEMPGYGQFNEWLYTKIHPEDLEHIKLEMGQLNLGQSPGFDLTIRVQHKDGYWKYVRWVAQVLESKKNYPNKVFGFIEDVTVKSQSVALDQDLADLRSIVHSIKSTAQDLKQNILLTEAT